MKENTILNAVWVLVIGSLLIIVITILVYLFRGHINFNDIESTTIGTFGDFIGGFIGTLFGIATLLLVWLTYNQQRDSNTAQEIQIARQNAIDQNQKFEATFFNLLAAHAQVKKNTTFDTKNRLSWWDGQQHDPSQVIGGEVFFSFAKEDFHRIYWDGNLQYPVMITRQDDVLAHLFGNNEEVAELGSPDRRIKLRYKRFLDVYHSSLGHYFRNLYYLLKYVDQHLEKDSLADPADANQIRAKYGFYIGIMQAQMSSSELFLLFYNGWCFPKMKSLILKYNLLENLAKEDLADTGRHESLYGENILKSRAAIIA